MGTTTKNELKTEKQKQLEEQLINKATLFALDIQQSLQMIQFRLISFQDFAKSVETLSSNYLNDVTLLHSQHATN
jgi:hypothetical protein